MLGRYSFYSFRLPDPLGYLRPLRDRVADVDLEFASRPAGSSG
ncbi:hypothetical protein [Streptomyces sp. NPDC058989]